jgi:phosphate-selective porin OprO and OprP
VQGEYAWTFASDSVGTLPGAKAAKKLGTEMFGGGYIQVSYFLTGENRTYDRRLGRLGSTYIANPFTPFWAVRGEDGRLSWGPGAWEVAARYSITDLNTSDGAFRGGKEDGLEMGLNWYLNTNLKVQFEYLHNDRFDLGKGVLPGNVNALGIRTQFFF